MIFLLFILSTSTFAQFIKKGSVIGGGSFDFSTRKVTNSDSKSASFSMLPWAAYSVMDNFLVGANIEVGTSSSKSDDFNYKAKSSYLVLGPTVRYYLNKGLFGHLQYDFGWSKINIKNDGSESSNNYFNQQFRAGVGYALRVNDKVLFEPMMGYSHNSNSLDIATSSGFFIMGGFTIILKSAP
jgi:Outer membrane protein beta-barrel domain